MRKGRKKERKKEREAGGKSFPTERNHNKRLWSLCVCVCVCVCVRVCVSLLTTRRRPRSPQLIYDIFGLKHPQLRDVCDRLADAGECRTGGLREGPAVISPGSLAPSAFEAGGGRRRVKATGAVSRLSPPFAAVPVQRSKKRKGTLPGKHHCP